MSENQNRNVPKFVKMEKAFNLALTTPGPEGDTAAVTAIKLAREMEIQSAETFAKSFLQARASQQKDKRFAMYHGKKYEVVFQGETKFGYRAKLGYLDGSNEFWPKSQEDVEFLGEPAKAGDGDEQGELQVANEGKEVPF
jgi:hypothetical protein